MSKVPLPPPLPKEWTQPPNWGRPTAYTEVIAHEIIERLTDGETLNAICRDEHMPDARTVRRWALDLKHPFSPRYTKAREIGYHKMADDIVEIADDGRNDWMEKHGEDDLGWKANGDHIARSRLRVDTRKWLLSKALPKIYGDKLALTDPDGGPLVVNIVKGLADPNAGN